MRPINEIIEDYLAARADYKNMSIAELPDYRIRLSFLLAELSDWIPEVEKRLSSAKNAQIEAYKRLREERVSCADADKFSRLEAFEKIWQAEYHLTRIKQLLSSGSDILNAILSASCTM